MGANSVSHPHCIQELLQNIRSGIENPFDFCKAKELTIKNGFSSIDMFNVYSNRTVSKSPQKMFETPCIYTKSLHINSNIAQLFLTRLKTHLKDYYHVSVKFATLGTKL